MNRLFALGRDTSGAAVIELAIAAPMLAAMIIGMADLSSAYSAKLQVEQIAQRSIERIQQKGYNVTGQTTKAVLEAEATAAAGTGSTATLTAWAECRTSGGVYSTTTFNGTCGATDTYARYVQIDVTKTYTPVIMARFAGSASNGSFTVHGIAGIRVQ